MKSNDLKLLRLECVPKTRFQYDTLCSLHEQGVKQFFSAPGFDDKLLPPHSNRPGAGVILLDLKSDEWFVKYLNPIHWPAIERACGFTILSTDILLESQWHIMCMDPCSRTCYLWWLQCCALFQRGFCCKKNV